MLFSSWLLVFSLGFGLFGLRSGFLGRRLLFGGLWVSHDRGIVDYDRSVHPLDERHRGGIAGSLSEFDDTSVTTLALSAAGSELGEQLADGFGRASAVVAQESEGAAAGMEIAALGEGDHFLSQGPHCLGLGQGSFDAAMLDEAAGLVGKQRIAVLGQTAQFNGFITVTHGRLFEFADRIDEAGFEFHTEA